MTASLSVTIDLMARRVATVVWWVRAIALMLLVHMAGCGPSGPAMEPVTGVVSYNGRPVAGARITFVAPNSPRVAVGTTNEAGEFTLSTMSDGDGAVVGKHQVSITSFTPEAIARMSNAQQEALGRGQKVEGSSLPTRYASFETSGLSANVEAGGENHFKFDLDD
ncbi:MAG: carboxypeptidase regulatory-like domain-containing protein [Planctomycetes bacterium]|nr:carboxypeptidase regulatory-like domain-containing protein [Planctomycetota bacterium]